MVTKYESLSQIAQYEKKKKPYWKILYTIIGIVGTLVGLGRFLFGDGILYKDTLEDKVNQYETDLENKIKELEPQYPTFSEGQQPEEHQ